MLDMTMTLPAETASELSVPILTKPARITSIDAARGFVMLTMIYVNDLAGAAPGIVPWWMNHYDEMRPRPPVEDGMTFVDMVFPGFLFLVGMSIPFALGNRLKKGEPWWSVLGHVVVRTLSLLTLGILMVNAENGPNHAAGLSRDGWTALMFTCGILAFVDLSPFWLGKDDLRSKKLWRGISGVIRVLGMAGLIVLAFAYQNVSKKTGHVTHLITLWPFSIRTEWFGILGMIGWSYFMAAVVYLFFRNRRLPLAVATALLLGFWVANQNGSFDHFYLPGFLAPIGDAIAAVVGGINRHVDWGIGSSAAITTAGILLATILVTPDTAATWARIKFTLLFVGSTALGAMLFYKPFLVWKDSATPPWCLWAMAITGAVWLVFYAVGDVLKWTWVTKPFAIAGQNVLLAYLFSEMMESVLNLMSQFTQSMFHLAGPAKWYDTLGGPTLGHAMARALGIGIVLLALTAGLNRGGLRLKL
jgi:heparan-alpha-glucosaminide N-acetyltransferase